MHPVCKYVTSHWGTPLKILQTYVLHNVIDVTPFDQKFNGKFFDAFESDWGSIEKTYYLNPPYNELARKWASLIDFKAKAGFRMILLMPTRNCAKYWNEKIRPHCKEICLVPHRVTFIDLKQQAKKPTAAPFSVMFCYINCRSGLEKQTIDLVLPPSLP